MGSNNRVYGHGVAGRPNAGHHRENNDDLKALRNEFRNAPIGFKRHFLDSGSFSLWKIAAKYAEDNKCKDHYAFYHTDEFWQYLEDYANGVKRYADGIDFYANIDVIPNPELTWRNQQVLEGKYGLKPVPVIHYRTKLSWLQKYIDAGHEYIALGGLVGSMAKPECSKWITNCFALVCRPPDYLPTVKYHGFGVSGRLMTRFPWYSVDSSLWITAAGHGFIWVPKRRKGAYVFGEEGYKLFVSVDSIKWNDRGEHYNALTKVEKKLIRDWLDHIEVPWGKTKMPSKKVIEYGVENYYLYRAVANLKYFEELRASVPPWPWPFKTRRGLL